MTGSDSRDLTRAEQSYAAQVGYQLRHEPQERRRAMMLAVRRTLLSGVPVDTYARLERELGTPAGYAERLSGRGDAHDVAPRPAAARRGSGAATALWVAVAVVAAIAVMVAVVLAAR